MAKIVYDTEMAHVIQELDAAINALEDAGNLFALNHGRLNDASKWAGAARDTCLETHDATEKYRQAILPIFRQLKTSLSELNADAEKFRY